MDEGPSASVRWLETGSRNGQLSKGGFSLVFLVLVFLFASRLAIRVYSIVIGNSETNFPSTNTTRAERDRKEFSSVQFSFRLFVTRSRTIPPPLLCGMDVFMLIEKRTMDEGFWLQTGQIRFHQERNLVSFKDGERGKKSSFDRVSEATESVYPQSKQQ